MSEQALPPDEKEIRRRARFACDACRSRKVKCVVSDGPVCHSCQELSILCTHQKPRKRRGPVNRYVLSQQRSAASNELSESASPVTPYQTVCGSDRLAPLEVIERIVHDWFEILHSVAPIFHRATFLNRLRSDESTRDSVFACLVIAVCAATIASLKRKSSVEFGDLTVEKCVVAVDQIEKVIGKQPWSLDLCQMRYHLGVALHTERPPNDQEGFRLFSDSAAAAKFLVYYGMSDMLQKEQQLLKRQFWLLFVAFCTLSLHGRPHINILTPLDNISSLMPLELTDHELDSAQTIGYDSDWHGNTKSYIPGLNFLCKLFLLWYESQQDPHPSISKLQHYSNLIQRALDYLPPELSWRGGLSRPPQSNFGTEVQTANLYITQLHIRSSLLEQMNHLSKSSTQVVIFQEITHGRQSIVEDLLEILYHMPEEILEANGHSLIPKIRDVGSALLDDVRTGNRGEAVSAKASVNLERLLAKLKSLDAQSRMYYIETGAVPGMSAARP